jgi:purine nucleoside permease
MRYQEYAAAALLSLCSLSGLASAGLASRKIAPKVMIISMVGKPRPFNLTTIIQETYPVLASSQFTPEANIWYSNLPKSGLGDLLARNISAPGLSVQFPHIHCTSDGSICQVTTAMAEINAAATMTAVILSPHFDLRKTYFLIAGIAGVSPKVSTLGGVALARYAVQVALQYEFDAREMPGNFSVGYVSYGTTAPNQYPKTFYGTEVMEVNAALLDVAFGYASKAKLADNAEAESYRARYKAGGEEFAAATRGPSVVKCDAATSDVYYSGTILSEAFENVTAIWTNGTGKYCMTAQEDNATLEVLMRMAIHGLVDFARVIVMRTGNTLFSLMCSDLPSGSC